MRVGLVVLVTTGLLLRRPNAMMSVLFWVWLFGGCDSTCVVLVLVLSTVVGDEDLVVDGVVGCELVFVCDCINADSVLGGRRLYGEAVMVGSYR